jgi:biotin operon repressor
MSITKYIDRLRYVDLLIRTTATGDPKALAKKLHLSRSSTLAYIKEMKELGFPIKYSFTGKHYYYEENGAMAKKLFTRSGDNEED